MSWSIGWDSDYNRWKGYGVPCTCEYPECNTKTDRGMACLCEGCGLAFCGKHWLLGSCERCLDIDDIGERPEGMDPFPVKPEHPEWLHHLRTDSTWAKWRKDPKNMQQLEAWERTTEAAKQGNK